MGTVIAPCSTAASATVPRISWAKTCRLCLCCGPDWNRYLQVDVLRCRLAARGQFGEEGSGYRARQFCWCCLPRSCRHSRACPCWHPWLMPGTRPWSCRMAVSASVAYPSGPVLSSALWVIPPDAAVSILLYRRTGLDTDAGVSPRTDIQELSPRPLRVRPGWGHAPWLLLYVDSHCAVFTILHPGYMGQIA